MAVIELGDGWQARPLKGFRCWQLYERVDTDPKTGDPLDEPRWRALECYPSTLALAVRFAAERGLQGVVPGAHGPVRGGAAHGGGQPVGAGRLLRGVRPVQERQAGQGRAPG